MHRIEQILGPGRVVEFGKRAALNEEAHMDAIEACYIGGGLRVTSSDTAACAIPEVVSGGTTAHRYYAARLTEMEATIRAIEETDSIAILPDLVDSHAGIDRIVNLKKHYRYTGKKIAIRLDSGDLAGLARYAFEKYRAEGMLDPVLDRIVIADVSSIEKLESIETALGEIGFIDAKKYVSYGLGGLLVTREKTRDTLSAGYKLTQIGDRATGKISDDVGKEALPGRLNVQIYRHGEGPMGYYDMNMIRREIVQEDESTRGERLLSTVYNQGELIYSKQDEEDNSLMDRVKMARRSYADRIRTYVENQSEIYPDFQTESDTKAISNIQTTLSPATKALRTKVRNQLRDQAKIIDRDDLPVEVLHPELSLLAA